MDLPGSIFQTLPKTRNLEVIDVVNLQKDVSKRIYELQQNLSDMWHIGELAGDEIEKRGIRRDLQQIYIEGAENRSLCAIP